MKGKTRRLISDLLILIAFAIVLSFAVHAAHAVERDSNGRIVRSQSAVNKFKATNICPSTKVIGDKCPGYVVDHIIPLCADGPDLPINMQWQEYHESLIKDRWERKVCTAKRHGVNVQ